MFEGNDAGVAKKHKAVVFKFETIFTIAKSIGTENAASTAAITFLFVGFLIKNDVIFDRRARVLHGARWQELFTRSPSSIVMLDERQRFGSNGNQIGNCLDLKDSLSFCFMFVKSRLTA